MDPWGSTLRIAPSLSPKNYTWVEVTEGGKQSNLVRYINYYGCKRFYDTGVWVFIDNTLFSSYLTNRSNGLECLSMASLSRLELGHSLAYDAVYKLRKKSSVVNTAPGACILKHYGFVIYGKWPAFTVSYCLLYYQSQKHYAEQTYLFEQTH